MKRLNKTNWDWWTRRVGGYTILCVRMYHPSPLVTHIQTWETVIGRQSKIL